jgi:SAM-dependent methyltransferase
VACGWGRHAVELADRGYAVTGLDFSPLLLREAERGATAAGVDLTLHCGDMREMDFDADFDGAVSLFSSLGYFGSDAEDLSVLQGIRRALRPGGRFVLDTMHRDLVAREFLERDWWSTPEGDHVWVERDFDPVEGVSHEVLRWRDREGEKGEKAHSIRIRSATEWQALLREAALRPEEWFGSWELEPFSHSSARLIVLCTRD